MNLRPAFAILLAACLCAPILFAKDAPAGASPFADDLDAARARAKASHKDTLVDFTGSDWCGFCIKLDEEVFHTAEFKAKAPALFELVQLDFPQQKKLPAETQARNDKWRKELGASSFPEVLILDETGRVYARTGYRAGGPTVYLKYLDELRTRRDKRDEALAKAAKASGLEKAKHLDAALSALRNNEVLLNYYGPTIKEIQALDAKDEAGLKTKYAAIAQNKQREDELLHLAQDKDGKAMLAKLKIYADRKDISAETRQYALYMAGAMGCERVLHDYPQALAFAKQAVAAAPESELVKEALMPMIDRLEKRPGRPKGR